MERILGKIDLPPADISMEGPFLSYAILPYITARAQLHIPDDPLITAIQKTHEGTGAGNTPLWERHLITQPERLRAVLCGQGDAQMAFFRSRTNGIPFGTLREAIYVLDGKLVEMLQSPEAGLISYNSVVFEDKRAPAALVSANLILFEDAGFPQRTREMGAHAEAVELSSTYYTDVQIDHYASALAVLGGMRVPTKSIERHYSKIAGE